MYCLLTGKQYITRYRWYVPSLFLRQTNDNYKTSHFPEIIICHGDDVSIAISSTPNTFVRDRGQSAHALNELNA